MAGAFQPTPTFQLGVGAQAFNVGFQPIPAFQLRASGYAFQQGGEAPTVDRGVVLFPPEPLRFRSRWDKTAYAWAVFTRDMRAPTEGFRPMADRRVDAVRLAAR